MCWVVEPGLGKHCEMAGKNLSSRAESFDNNGWQVNLDLARWDKWTDHPHCLRNKVSILVLHLHCGGHLRDSLLQNDDRIP